MSYFAKKIGLSPVYTFSYKEKLTQRNYLLRQKFSKAKVLQRGRNEMQCYGQRADA
jgi:hypothetical protein